MSGRIKYIISRFKITEIFITVLFIISLLISIHALLLAIKFNDIYPGFFTYSNAMVSITQRNSWNGVRAGLRPLDVIIKVNNQEVKSGNEIYRIIEERPAGTEFEYNVLQGTDEKVVRVRSSKLTVRDKIFTFYLPYSIGLLFLLMGGVVFFIKMQERANRIFLIFCSLIGIFFTTGFEVNTTYAYSRIWLLYPFFGAASLHLFLTFPEERRRVKTYPGLLAIPYLIVGIPVLFHEIFYNSYRASYFFFKSIPPLMGLLFFLDIAVLAYTAIKASSPSIKHKAKALIITVLCASTFGVLWSLTFPLRSEYVTLDRAVILSMVFPIFMAYAILKENIFDIDRFIQNTMIYAVLSALVVGIYFLLVGITGFFTQKVFAIGHTPFENILSILAIVALLHPLRAGVQKIIRRTFYVDELRVQTELVDLLTELGKIMEVEVIAEKIVNWIKKNLKFDSSFYILNENRLIKIRSTMEESPDYIMLPPSENLTKLSSKGYISVTSFISRKNIDPELRYFFSAPGNSIIIPIKVKNKLLGILGVGKLHIDTFIRKRDEEVFKVISENIGFYVDNAINYAENARRERLATLGKMGTIIMHEIKNPLGIIKSSAGALRKRLDLNEKENELLSFIEEEADRINNTVRKVLEFAKPAEPVFSTIDICEVTRRAVKMMETHLGDSGVKINVEIPESSIMIKGDPNLLHQAFLNILQNSAEVLKNGGTIWVYIKRSLQDELENEMRSTFVTKMKELGARVIQSFSGARNITIIIEDDGPGIREEEKNKIFEPFYSTKQDGTGLGLAITKQIIESHNGRIRAERKEVKGTRFVIELPV